MPAKRKAGGRKKAVGGRKRAMPGKGFWSKIGNAFKSAGNFVKDQAVKAAPAIVSAVKNSGVVGSLAGQINPGLGVAAKAVGLGRRRRVGGRKMLMGQGGRGAVTNENVKVMAF